jgi:hypothetical protein
MLLLAYGLYRRQQWAWHLGLIFIGVAGLRSCVHSFTSSQFARFPELAAFPHSALLRVVFAVVTRAVTGYWAGGGMASGRTLRTRAV